MNSKREGNQFERLFERIAHMQGIAILRIADGCRRVPGFKKIIPTKQPCDWILGYQGKAAVIDTKKQEKGNTFSHQKLDPNQIAKMMEMYRQGIIGGYVIYQRSQNRLVFVHVLTLFNCLKMGLSVKLTEQVTELGSLENCDLKGIFEWTGSED